MVESVLDAVSVLVTMDVTGGLETAEFVSVVVTVEKVTVAIRLVDAIEPPVVEGLLSSLVVEALLPLSPVVALSTDMVPQM